MMKMSTKSIDSFLTSCTQSSTKEKQEEMENEYHEKSLYLAKCAHELKNVFLAVSGLLESDSGIKDEKVQFITTLCNFGLNIVSEMNTVCLKDFKPNGDIHLISDQFAIIPSIDFCVNMFEVKQRYEKRTNANVFIKKNINLNKNQLVTSINENHFKQIMINLISNACKFTLKGEIVVSCNYIDNNSKIKITIKDTGIGLSEDDIKGLFHPFGKGFHSNQMNQNGSGLGLCIIQDILLKYNSLLNVSSIKGIGTSFWFDLAIGSNDSSFDDESLTIDENSSNNETSTLENINIVLNKKGIFDTKPSKESTIQHYLYKENSIHKTKMKMKIDIKSRLINKLLIPDKKNIKAKELNIVICDDEPIIANSMKNLIEAVCTEKNMKPPDVTLRTNGIEYLYELYNQTMQGKAIDLLIIDENMPYMTGSNLIKIIKSIQIFNSFPVYLLSSSAITLTSTLLSTLNCSVDGFSEKPLNKNSFLNMIKTK